MVNGRKKQGFILVVLGVQAQHYKVKLKQIKNSQKTKVWCKEGFQKSSINNLYILFFDNCCF